MNKLILGLLFSLTLTSSYAQYSCIKSFQSFIDKRLMEYEFTKITKKHKRLATRLSNYRLWSDEQVYRKQINDISQLPFELSSKIRKISNEEMINRFPQLDIKIQESIIQIYNRLSDKEKMISYSIDLYKEVVVYMFNHPRRMKLDNFTNLGNLDNRAYANVLIQRMKKHGDANFIKLSAGKILGKVDKDVEIVTRHDLFRQAVSSGPFFDMTFDYGFSGHGVFAHLAQRDMICDILVDIWGDDYLEFYRFLGTKAGVNWWIDLFDSSPSVETSFSHPEHISKFSQMLKSKILE